MKFKIGEEVKLKESFEIETFDGRKIAVKDGDKGIIVSNIVTSNSFVHYISGNAKGVMQELEDVEVEGYDYRNISSMILDRLNAVFRLEDFLEDKGIGEEEIINEMEEVLVGIL